MSAILGRASFEQKVGHVSALGAGLAKLGCYAVRNSHDTNLEFKKVVYDSTSTNERAGDYLPLVRANGRRSANLAFNVPGFAWGGPAVDHWPAGTNGGAPSIDISPRPPPSATGGWRTTRSRSAPAARERPPGRWPSGLAHRVHGVESGDGNPHPGPLPGG
jgi:hypothetical protein